MVNPFGLHLHDKLIRVRIRHSHGHQITTTIRARVQKWLLAWVSEASSRTYLNTHAGRQRYNTVGIFRQTSTSTEDESIVLVDTEVGGVDGSVGYVTDSIAAHTPVVVGNREGVEWLWLTAQEVSLLRHWKGIKRARATTRRHYPPKHGLDKIV